MLDKSSNFLLLEQPCEPESLDVSFNIMQELKKYAQITCDCGQHGGHSILNGKERR